MSDWFDFVLPILLVAALFAFWVERTRTAFAGVREFPLPHPKSAADSELFGLGAPDELRRLVPEDVYQLRRVRAFGYSLVIFLSLATCIAIVFEAVPMVDRHPAGSYFVLILIISTRRVPWTRLGSKFLPRTFLHLGPNPFSIEREEGNVKEPDPRMGCVMVAAMILIPLAAMVSPGDPDWPWLIPTLLLFGVLSLVYLPRPNEMSLSRQAIDDEHTLTGWRSVVAYHWYSARQGVVFVRRTSPLLSPLVILPVPADKVDDVERILNERLPGKRGEDVEVPRPPATT